ncbi:MAG: hypothetical protein KBC32_07150 [Candidatus Didemnitutus sp.]|nr:hypothetical protein [Candidatus Didemnitutus sp.]
MLATIAVGPGPTAGSMKLVRLFLVLFAILVGLTTLLAGLAMLPPVQRWAVRQWASGQTGFTLDVAAIAAGPQRAVLSNVTFEQPGLKLTIANLELRYSVWTFLAAGRLEVGRLHAIGVRLDATPSGAPVAPADTAVPSVAAPVMLNGLELPWQIVADDLRIEGTALLPAAEGRQAATAQFRLTGGGIAPGREGELVLEAAVADPTPEAVVTNLRVDSRLRVRQTETHQFDHANLTLVIEAEGKRFTDPPRLQVNAQLDTGVAQQAYRLEIDTVRAGGAENLLRLQATSRDAAAHFDGEWKIHARSEQVEPFLLGARWPQFTAQGAGHFTLARATGAFTVRGRAEGEVGGLDVIEPGLRALGTLRVDTEFDFAEQAGRVRVDRLRVNATAAQPVVSFELNRALAFDLSTHQVEPGDETAGDVATLQIHHLPLAWANPFLTGLQVKEGALSGRLVATREDGRLALQASDPVRLSGLTILQNDHALLEQADLAWRTEILLSPAEWRMTARDFTLRTPAGDRLDGRFSALIPLGGTANGIGLQGALEGDLPRLVSDFVPLGHVQGGAQWDIVLQKDTLEIRSLAARLAEGQSGRTLLAARTSQPLTIGLPDYVVRSAVDDVEVARISVGAVSLGALSGLPTSVPLTGELAAVEFAAVVRQGRLQLASDAPLRVTDFGVFRGTDRAVTGLTFEAAPTFDFGGAKDWKLRLGSTAFREPSGAALSTVEFEVGENPANGFRGALSFSVDLARLGKHPLGAAMPTLVAGRASGELRAASMPDNPDVTMQIEARATLNGLVLREGNQSLPVANLGFRGVRAADGRISLEAPLLLDRLGKRSDLRMLVEAIERDDGLLFDAKLTGEHVELADALALAGLFGAPASVAATPTPKTPEPTPADVRPDAEPFWSGVRGELVIDLKSITRGADWAMTGFNGYVLVDPRRISVQKIEGQINERARLAARADLRFAAGEVPYELAGNFSLTEFDAGAFLKAFGGEPTPVVEGLFTVAGGFAGDGRDLEHTLERTRGNLQLTSRQGVFRGLRRASEKTSMASKAVELGAALGSLFGSNKVKEAAEKVAGQSYQVDQLAQALAELPFDQMVIRLNRDDDLNFRLEELSLLTPEVRLHGRGSIAYVAGKPLLEQPLSVTCSLAARGKIEQQLARLRVLDGTKDELGYARVRDAGSIGGTLARPDARAFFLRLADSKLGDLLSGSN